MPTRVLLLRHAESADPTVFHGAESDVDLSDRGRSQAEGIAKVLAARQPDLLVSSAMRRARATAEAIGLACALPVQLEPDLHERRVSMLSGQRIEDHQSLWTQTVDHWMRGDIRFTHAGAESFADVRARVLPVWERLITQHAGRTLVIVAHGIVCKVLLLSVLANHSPADWRTKVPSLRNVAINELVRDDAGWRALRLNWWPEEWENMSR